MDKVSNACVVCNHPGHAYVDKWIVDRVVSIDGKSYVTTPKLSAKLQELYPTAPVLRPYHVARHKKGGHVASLAPVQGGGQILVLKDKKLWRQNSNGELEELPSFSAEDALAMIVNIGLDNILKGRVTVGQKTVVDALKILTDLKKTREESDVYEQLIADKARGNVIDVTPDQPAPPSVDDVLSGLPEAAIPPGLEMPEDGDD